MEKLDLLITSTYIIPMNKKREIIKDGALGIRKGQIVWIGRKSDAEALKYEKIVDSGYSIMIPGFVNTHTHLAMVGFRGIADDLPLMEWLQDYIWPNEMKWVNKEFIKIVLPLGIIEMLRSGITTFSDMYFFQNVAAEIVKNMGIRAVLGEGLIDFETPSFKNPKEALNFTESFIKEWQGDEMVLPAVAPHAPYTCSKDLLISSKEISDKFNVPCLIHIAETCEEIKEIRRKHGKTSVKYLKDLGFLSKKTVAAHSIWLDEDEIEIYKEYEVGVSHNPTSNLKLASGIAPVHKYLKKGIKIGLGTDGAASNNNLDFLEEIHIASLIHKVNTKDPTVCSSWDVLYMATLGGAKVLGMQDKIGSLELGKKADIVVFDLTNPHSTPIFNPLSHLVYSAKSSDIKYVLVDGKLILDEGEFPHFDVDEIIYNVNMLSEKIKYC